MQVRLQAHTVQKLQQSASGHYNGRRNYNRLDPNAAPGRAIFERA